MNVVPDAQIVNVYITATPDDISNRWHKGPVMRKAFPCDRPNLISAHSYGVHTIQSYHEQTEYIANCWLCQSIQLELRWYVTYQAGSPVVSVNMTYNLHGCFRLCDCLSLWYLEPWINNLPLVRWNIFDTPIPNELVCAFYTVARSFPL